MNAAGVDDPAVMRDELDEAVHSLKGEHYSLMSISTTYDAESDATFAFLGNLTRGAHSHSKCSNTFRPV